MQKIEVVVRITKDHYPPQEQTIFEWFDLMRNPTNALRSPGLEINLEHHRVFKHGTEVYMSRYEYGVLSLMAQHPGKLFTKEQIFEAGALPVCGSSPLRFPAPLLDRKDRLD